MRKSNPLHQSVPWGLYLAFESGILALVGLMGPQYGEFETLPTAWILGVVFLVGATATAGAARTALRSSIVMMVSGLITYAAFGQLRVGAEWGFYMLLFIAGGHWTLAVNLLKPEKKPLALMGPPLFLISGASLAYALIPTYGMGIIRGPAILAVLAAALLYVTASTAPVKKGSAPKGKKGKH